MMMTMMAIAMVMVMMIMKIFSPLHLTEVLVWQTKTVKEKKSRLKPLDEARTLKNLIEHVSFTELRDVVGRKVNPSQVPQPTCYWKLGSWGT